MTVRWTYFSLRERNPVLLVAILWLVNQTCAVLSSPVVSSLQPSTSSQPVTSSVVTILSRTPGLHGTPFVQSSSTQTTASSGLTSMVSRVDRNLQSSHSVLTLNVTMTSNVGMTSSVLDSTSTASTNAAILSSSLNTYLPMHSRHSSTQLHTSGYSGATGTTLKSSSTDNSPSYSSVLSIGTQNSKSSTIFPSKSTSVTDNTVTSATHLYAMMHSSQTSSSLHSVTSVLQSSAQQTTQLVTGASDTSTEYSSSLLIPSMLSLRTVSINQTTKTDFISSFTSASKSSSILHHATLIASDTSAILPSTSSISPTSSISAFLPSLTTAAATSSLNIWLPTPSMIIQPPPLRTVTLPMTTRAPHRCITGSCCTYGLSQLPPHLTFEESKPKGFVMAEMRGITNVNFTVKVLNPPELTSLLHGSFSMAHSPSSFKLILDKEVDLEELYDLTDGKVNVHSLQLQITCTENSSLIVPPRMLNVTIEDVDDSMPVFSTPGTSTGDCVVPVYRADTSEDYTGELALSPGRIEAVDGDVSNRHNISYRVIHAEPDDYHVYFNVASENGTVHKTKSMNSSDPNKYVIFIQAVEDSPQQKSRVAVLSIVVVAPSDPLTHEHKANPTVTLVLQITCAFLFMAIIVGFVVIFHHRYTVSRSKVDEWNNDEEKDMKVPKLAVYQSSSSSLNSAILDVPTVTSPSQIAVCSDKMSRPESRVTESQRKRRLIVIKPLDTKARPSWNAPTPKPKPRTYNPFSVYQKKQKK